MVVLDRLKEVVIASDSLWSFCGTGVCVFKVQAQQLESQTSAAQAR